MGNVTDYAERLWTGADTTQNAAHFLTLMGLEELGPGLAFLSSFANVTLLDTDAGLLLIDTGSFFLAAQNHESIRRWSKRPLATAIYTHGHVDHAFGLGPFEAESGQGPVEVIAHEAVAQRFDRYQVTAGYNVAINRRQFGTARWPTSYRYPDRTYQSLLSLEVGGVQLELHHARGETDDHTWVHIPALSTLCTGDLFVWASPNCGNPQKVQRYPREWALALRQMADLDAERLLPGHGPPILGAERVRLALDESAEFLEILLGQTLDLMNQGATLDTILHSVKVPDRLLERPYLRPVYDEPEFVVRNIWRLYGGWYDGDPAHLKPPATEALASEIASLAGGPGKLAERAMELSDAGDHRLACQLVEYAFKAAEPDQPLCEQRREIYQRRVAAETSLMARGVFRAAAEER